MNLKSLKKYKVPISILAIVLLSLILIVTLMKPKNKESFFGKCSKNVALRFRANLGFNIDSNGKATFNNPGNCTSIGYEAFAANEQIISIDIPNSVRFFGENAFEGTSNLKTITFQPGSKLTHFNNENIFGGEHANIDSVRIINNIKTDIELNTYANDKLTENQIMTAFTHSKGGHVVVIYNSDTPEVKALCKNGFQA
jgi:hypothetical protein